MRNSNTCAQNGVQHVYQASKTVSSLCNFIVHSHTFSLAVYTSAELYTKLCNTCARFFPLKNVTINRGSVRLIPTIHSPNNKSYMDTLRINIEKLWIGGYTL